MLALPEGSVAWWATCRLRCVRRPPAFPPAEFDRKFLSFEVPLEVAKRQGLEFEASRPKATPVVRSVCSRGQRQREGRCQGHGRSTVGCSRMEGRQLNLLGRVLRRRACTWLWPASPPTPQVYCLVLQVLRGMDLYVGAGGLGYMDNVHLLPDRRPDPNG